MRNNKIENKPLKEKLRGGTKMAKMVFNNQSSPKLNKYINKIITGDAEKTLKLLPSNSIDIIITSPPYNFGHNYANDVTQDTRNWDEYFRKLHSVWQECVRILKPSGRIAINIQPLFSDYVPTHHIISKQLTDLGLLWKAEILWEKNNYNAKYTAWGSWKSPSMPYLKYTWEFIEVFDKESHKKTGQKENIDITDEEFKELVYAKWKFPPENKMQEFHHPAMFPEELPYRLLKLFSYRGDIVLDPFNGAGTTTLVAYKLKRKFIGIDISPEYCQTAIERIKQHTSQKGLFEEKLNFSYPAAELV